MGDQQAPKIDNTRGIVRPLYYSVAHEIRYRLVYVVFQKFGRKRNLNSSPVF